MDRELFSSTLEQHFLGEQKNLSNSGLNGASHYVESLRADGLSRFQSTGFPRPGDEAWKYTPVRKWLDQEFRFADPSYATMERLSPLLLSVDAYVAVCVNGVLDDSLSRLPSTGAATIIGLQKALAEDGDFVSKHIRREIPDTQDAFTALNQAFLQTGLYIRIPDHSVLDKPLYIVDLVSTSEPFYHQPRTVIVAGEASQATIIELRDNSSDAPLFESAVVQMHISKSAMVDHYHLMDRGDQAHLIRSLNVIQERDSTFSTNDITLSGTLVRSNLNFLPEGENCETHLNGFYLARGDMHVDVHTVVDHAKPNCVSNELFKGIIDDRATAVFNGRVLVRQDAQQINAYQSNRNILLSKRAHMYSKPELEIYADDVKCSHGATTGKLEDDAIFYLRSRGISVDDARRLLLEAFAADVVKLILVEDYREFVSSKIAAILNSNIPDSVTVV